ncbi:MULTISPECIES: M20/M25/M40 family metallo-hydrolase [unclassified Streptomyces]|uniref:M20/M25/M40 family metallo-hydrolase n=1 Tax=Streptomyces sp. NPDC127532 TaxID=3345399 RepID=UPI00363C7A3F
MRGLRARLPGAAVEVTGGPNRPPLRATASKELFARADRLATGLGLGPLTQVAVGGASDGNLAAGVGAPTLDGLGAVGGGAHADDEHLLVAELPPRTRLLSALVAGLLAPQEGCPPGRSGNPHPVPSNQPRTDRG